MKLVLELLQGTTEDWLSCLLVAGLGYAGLLRKRRDRQCWLVSSQLSSGFNGKIILETDNVLIAKELEKGRSNRSDCFQIICEIKDAMTVFESVSIKHIPRECNQLAHELAARARQHDDLFLIANVPEQLSGLMLSECNTSV